MGQLISKLLFQPPDPPSYTDNGDGKIIWLKCPAIKPKKKKDSSGGILVSSVAETEFDTALTENERPNGERNDKNVEVEIPACFLPYKGSDLCLLYSHGNATDLGQMMPYLELLRSSLKINVFSYEYQGYGISRPQVKATEARVCASIEAAVNYLTNEKKIPQNKIIVFGTSLGTGPTSYVASKESANFRGVILQSPFTSVVRIKVNTQKPVFFDMFQNINCVSKIKCPVFIIHGKCDEVVPFDHGETLYKKLKVAYKPLFIDYAGHNNIMEIMSVERYLKQLFKFIVYLNEYQANQQAAVDNING
jgi:predicted esterase